MWHAIIVPQSAPWITSTIQWPGTRWAAIWWSTPSPQGSLPLLILGYPNLPILIDFIKEKRKKLGPLDKKTEMICLAIGQSQPGIFYLQNYEFQRNTHFFTFYKKKKLPLLLNSTQFYILSHNSNLKMNLYEKLHFFMFYLDHQDNSKTLNNFFWTRIFLQIYTLQNE